MIVHTNFSTRDRRSFCFRRVLPDDAYSGVPGIYALTHAENLTVEPLFFEASNDLACIEESKLDANPNFAALKGKYKVGVAVFLMPRASAEQRDALASALNEAINDVG